MESEQTTPVDSTKDVVRSSVKVPEFDKHLKKVGEHIGRNVVEITIKMKTIVRKPLMIKIFLLGFVFNSNIFRFIFIYVFVNIRRSDWQSLSLFFVCSVVLEFCSMSISVLLLVFNFVFVQGSVCFISVEYMLFRFSWNLGHSFVFKFINFAISFCIYLLECCPGVFCLLFVLHLHIFRSHIAFNNFSRFWESYIFSEFYKL